MSAGVVTGYFCDVPEKYNEVLRRIDPPEIGVGIALGAISHTGGLDRREEPVEDRSTFLFLPSRPAATSAFVNATTPDSSISCDIKALPDRVSPIGQEPDALAHTHARYIVRQRGILTLCICLLRRSTALPPRLPPQPSSVLCLSSSQRWETPRQLAYSSGCANGLIRHRRERRPLECALPTSIIIQSWASIVPGTSPRCFRVCSRSRRRCVANANANGSSRIVDFKKLPSLIIKQHGSVTT